MRTEPCVSWRKDGGGTKQIWLRCLAGWRLSVLILDTGLQSNQSPPVLKGGVVPFPAHTKSVQPLSHSRERRGKFGRGESSAGPGCKDVAQFHSSQLSPVSIRDEGDGVSPFPKRNHKAGFMRTVKPLVFLNLQSTAGKHSA